MISTEDRTAAQKQRKAALLVTIIASFLTPYMAASISVALPTIGREFHMDALLLGWVATSFLLAAAMFLVPLGRIADIYGRKKVFTYGMSIFTLASLLCALSRSGHELIAFRVIQGIGGAMVFGTSVAILTSVFPPEERGKALGINVAAVYLGLSLGPFLGGLLVAHLGWRSIFYINAPLCAFTVVLVVLRLKGEWAESRNEPFDLVGSLIYGLSLVGVMYGFHHLPSLPGAAMIAGGIVGVLLFIVWEKRSAHPVFNVDLLFRNRIFAFSNLAALINYSATFAVTFLLSLYLQYVRGFGPERAGLLLIAQPVVQALFSPFAGRLSDRVEPRIVASTGMSLIVVGLVFFSFLQDSTPLPLIVSILSLLGLGFALFSSPNTNAIMGSVDRKFYGVASGSLATVRIIGQTFSMGITVLVFAVNLGRVKIEPQHYQLFVQSMRLIFVIFAGLCIVGVVASLVRGRMR